MNSKKPDSFRDLKAIHELGIPTTENKLMKSRYALEFRNFFATDWKSKLEVLIDSDDSLATKGDVVEALEALASFSEALENFRRIRQTGRRANQIDSLFLELRDKMSKIPDLKLGLSSGESKDKTITEL